jgi:hypothetical protein
MRIFLPVFATLLLGGQVRADTTDVAAGSPAVDTVEIRSKAVRDTVQFVPKLDESIVQQVTNPVDYEKRLTQNPTLALFKSLLVPGWGQIGNRKYIKAAVFIGLETWFAAAAIHQGKKANEFRDLWESTPREKILQRNVYYGLWQDRRDNRNQFLWFAGLTVFISMFDAYVDAQMSGAPFERSEDKVSLEVAPDSRGGASAQLTYSF